ncbi:2-C-methyl-D-erythritol 2,4-cyclodiphosphate synthase [uncultured Candidatus Thioglobus sp.]|uniref:2-C-methyl-D-erythritol 2,4-cyclodiphosphate synthase n=1 Tax=Bathymodiolus heckerae thiotrophic gill symbiont TaxID=1052212 RepID=UPI0010B12CE3|nr:2-C-methyl-D-erythritol 2,4-cyclodiphosphate synthase [Bathymodiolus heckerae thiotrophic gill symbiont]CAC9547756.1 2-C-methyl-D-erythritol 2,4-cyclodiphosphate synthase (EC 4.6.1.12) [uncultured Gammaproteobacteria bacterium]SMN17578.1 2-C-methyl-D-erythritol 2,4-cyclodiphosphate synthase [uncultured Candidatus Thioglobus sp.]CAC9602953.1 2-C-methyl-D-erythritol 2,4-cyclodiphosphate synthase (EC 4.6.1.12) [uncultured Gammaproteobacteria bacterium]CAC9952427.1 2-C-methyl-D-erythritol 2,4-cy
MKFKTGLGQDSHAFENNKKPLLLAGIDFNYTQGLGANSDGDVLLHALTNAISSLTGVNILGAKADELCQQGVTDSREYLKLALAELQDWDIQHVAISIECLVPKISPKIENMKNNLASLLNVSNSDIGITATTGEGLTAFGRGEGIQVLCIISATQS